MIPGVLLSAFPHRQFHTLPSLLDSWAALPNSNPNACMPMQGGSLYHFYDGLWYDPAERRTHDLPCERRTRYRLSQTDTVWNNAQFIWIHIDKYEYLNLFTYLGWLLLHIGWAFVGVAYGGVALSVPLALYISIAFLAL